MIDIIERLLDSEEHATAEAIPPVAEDAAEEIGALREQLAASPATGANHAPR